MLLWGNALPLYMRSLKVQHFMLHAIMRHLYGYRIQNQSKATLLFEKRSGGVLDAGLRGKGSMS